MTALSVTLASIFGVFLLWIWTPKLPRQLAAETAHDLRWYRAQTRFQKQLPRHLKYVVVFVSVLGAALILSRPQAPVEWVMMSLILNLTLIAGGLIDHQTGLLPFNISLILGGCASLFQSVTASDQLIFHLWTSLGSTFVLLTLNRISCAAGRGAAMGGGDIANLAALAWLFLPEQFAWLLLLAALSGLIESRLRRQGSSVRFGPHLAATAALLWYAFPTF